MYRKGGIQFVPCFDAMFTGALLWSPPRSPTVQLSLLFAALFNLAAFYIIFNIQGDQRGYLDMRSTFADLPPAVCADAVQIRECSLLCQPRQPASQVDVRFRFCTPTLQWLRLLDLPLFQPCSSCMCLEFAAIPVSDRSAALLFVFGMVRARDALDENFT